MNIVLKHSRQCSIFFLLLHGAAIYVVATLKWMWLCKTAVILICVGSYSHILFCHALHSTKNGVISLWRNSYHNWQLLQRNGAMIEALLSPDSVITKYIAILNFSSLLTRDKMTVVIFPDMLSLEDFRRLRMHLSSYKILCKEG